MKSIHSNKKKFYFKHIIYKEGISHKTDSLSFGNVALMTTSSGVVTKEQLESARLVIRRLIGKNLKILIKVKPFLAITKKSSGVRMGKGKGSFDTVVFFLKKDEILFELRTKSQIRISKALYKASAKLPLDCKVVML